jgi:alkylated DNA repair dioxygenase AlkB
MALPPLGLQIMKGQVPAKCDEKGADPALAPPPCLRCQRCLLTEIEGNPWSAALTRKTQQYGAAGYDYATKRLDPLVAAMTPSIEAFAETMPGGPYTQCIVNKYERGERISAHVDHRQWFGPRVASVSLGASAVMRFTRDGESYGVELEAGDVVVMEGEAREEWMHEILPLRGAIPRVSVTYRTMKRARD